MMTQIPLLERVNLKIFHYSLNNLEPVKYNRKEVKLEKIKEINSGAYIMILTQLQVNSAFINFNIRFLRIKNTI